MTFYEAMNQIENTDKHARRKSWSADKHLVKLWQKHSFDSYNIGLNTKDGTTRWLVTSGDLTANDWEMI
jgi:hypothetical protein